MRLWSIWNLLSSLLFFTGVFICVLAVGCVLYYAYSYAQFWVVLLACCLLAGIVLGVIGNIGRTREARRSQQIDAELAEIVRDGQKTLD